jgi:two-component sensor histidine kinase
MVQPKPDVFQPAAADQTPVDGDLIAMRQLRHHTKNTLQRIIGQLATADMRATSAGSALADDLERRIFLSARISDALFGLTAPPGPMDMRLTALAQATVALLGHPKQTIAIDVAVTGACPGTLQATIVQIAYEMLGNAVKHGLHMRLNGRISIRLTTDDAVTLVVSDDGWGPRKATEGEGLPIMRALADQHGGSVALTRRDGWTAASLHLPLPAEPAMALLSQRRAGSAARTARDSAAASA